MKYSVLIPVYKTNEEDLEKCIKSILSNHYEDYEIIVVEALSEGNSVCNKIKNYPHVKYFISDIASAPYQRNLTLKYSSGHYIIFVDSDDYVSSDIFELADKYIGDSDLLIMNHTSEKFALPCNDKCESKTETQEIKRLFYMQNPHSFECRSIWGKVYKRNVIIDNNINFDLSLKSTQDYFFNLSLSKYLKIVNLKLDCKVYHYQFSQTSMTKNRKTSSPERFLALIDAWKKILEDETQKECEENQNFYFNVVVIYIPMMLNNYFRNYNIDTFSEFRSIIQTEYFQESIHNLKYSNCPSLKKKVLLFLLRKHCYKLVMKLYFFK